MTTRMIALCTGALLASLALANQPASALTMQECSAKYKAAQAAGSLKGQKWNDFRKAECGADATAAPAPAAAKPVAPVASTPPAVPAQPAAVKPAPAAKSAANPPASALPPAAAPPAVIVVAPVRIFALVRTSCRAEYRAYCSDVDIGGGRVVACLQANAASLSPTCQSGLAELGR